MVNLPDWQSLTWRADDGDWLDLAASRSSEYVQELDLRRGVLHRRFIVEDAAGGAPRVAQRRFVSMADPYLAALECTLVPENWSGRLDRPLRRSTAGSPTAAWPATAGCPAST